MRKQGKIARCSLGLAVAAITTLTILGLGPLINFNIEGRNHHVQI